MSYDLVGKNPGTMVNLGYSHAIALKAVLAELTGKEADFLHPATEQQCKIWADALRNNLKRIKLIEGVNKEIGLRGLKYGFLVVQGTDIKRQFSSGHYRNEMIDFEPSWEMAKELDGVWKIVVDAFIKFLDSCRGIVEVV
jgi:hypothetical protein